MRRAFAHYAAILCITGFCAAAQAQSPDTLPTLNLPDAGIVTAFQMAATQNVLAAVNPNVFPGYWSVCADGQGYGYGNTFPSVDGGQMTNALLVAGQVNVVEANFNYVTSFMKPNGLLPLAIFPGAGGQWATSDGNSVQVDANGGLYTDPTPGNPLGATGSITYIQNADAIFRYTHDTAWLNQQLASINLTASYLASLTNAAGAVGGAGYYTESPARSLNDGITQSYAADAFQRVAALNTLVGNTVAAQKYQALANTIISNFQTTFWSASLNRFAMYYNPTYGFITDHGLSDTDWAAIACGTATPAQTAALWPQLQQATSAFDYAGIPGGVSTITDNYQDWECSGSNRGDVAAMGRVWLVQAAARVKMGDGQGLVDSIIKVAQVGQNNGYYWQERYNASGGYGVSKYNEYPANLMTIVEHDLLGVNSGLDGSLEIKPTAPASYWSQGFGQTLTLPGGTLAYTMYGDHMTGDYFGSSPQTLRVWLPQAAVGVTINGLPVDATVDNGELVFLLPAASAGQPCYFEVLTQVPEPGTLALLAAGLAGLLCYAWRKRR